MAVDANFEALFRDLKPDDPWLPPKAWESIPSESGFASASSTRVKHFSNSSAAVSEGSMVRLALNALQGSDSAILCIEKLAETFCLESADRTFHQIPSLWNRVTSTQALGKLLQEIGCAGSSVFLLYKFVSYFTDFGSTESDYLPSFEGRDGIGDEVEKQQHCSLVNQAFAVAVGKVLGGYIGALETICASVAFRRSGKVARQDYEVLSEAGCLKSIVHNEITLLEVYLHTAELRIQMRSLANICKIQMLEGNDFSSLSLSDALERAAVEFSHFPRGACLLSYLYSRLEVAEPTHTALVKFLFQKSCEPYFRFIRQWIFEAHISDPYNEFIVGCVENVTSLSPGRVGIFTDMQLATVRVREKATVPCFLSAISTLLFRAGQQLQVVKRMLEICSLNASSLTYDEIVPCFTNDLPSFASVLSFKKKDLEAMVNQRNTFYELLRSKLEKFSVKLHVSFDQLVRHGVSVSSESQTVGSSADVGDDLSTSDYKQDLNMIAGKQGAGTCSSSDEFSDPTNASDWSSSSCYDDDSEPEHFLDTPSSHPDSGQKYLSSLRFSSVIPTECSFGMSPLNVKSCVAVARQKPECCTMTDCDTAHTDHDKHMETNSCSSAKSLRDPNWSWMPINREDIKHSDVCMPFVKKGKSYSLLNGKEESPSTPEKFSSGMMLSESYLTEDESRQSGTEDGTVTSKSWMLKQPRNFLSRNPMLRKSAYIHKLCKDKEDAIMDNRGTLSSFDFSNVENPFMGLVDKNGTQLSHTNEPALKKIMESDAVATDVAACISYQKDNCEKDIINGIQHSVPAIKPNDGGPNNHLVGASGGSGWEKQLFNFSFSPDMDAKCKLQSADDVFEMPVDFIMDKCLFQEIKLQYKYISELTIKLLKEGFGLQEHLMALQRYHLMGVADWADIFIMSLWHHKWCREEGEKRIPQLQGMLESSIQRSSCEQDPLKDRVYVFRKQHSTSSLDEFAGVRSFEFLGLGYRVDWPASVVLASGALRIYSQIFNFLIQVKLANFALTDIWCSLKDLKHMKHDSGSLGRLTKLRHQINHFVTSLQHYLQSQLSHISWTRFLQSLENKVKDMMDFETVHNDYLTDCLQICFLSDETKTISSIITDILQCTLDFRSSMMHGTGRVTNDSSCINSQITSIKNTFDKNLKELYIRHLKSHQHTDSGLHQFWEVLNHNDFYSSIV